MNSHQRRKFKRFLDREALPRIKAGDDPIDVAANLNISYISLIKYLHKQGYRQTFIGELQHQRGCMRLYAWIKEEKQ
jgi:hypothetical protein